VCVCIDVRAHDLSTLGGLLFSAQRMLKDERERARARARAKERETLLGNSIYTGLCEWLACS